MGGRSSSSNIGVGRNASSLSISERVQSSPDYVGQRNIEDQVSEQIRYGMLGEGEDLVAVRSVTIDTNPGDGEVGDVTAEYQVRVDTSYEDVDADGYRQTIRDYETEYRTDTFQVRLKRRRSSR